MRGYKLSICRKLKEIQWLANAKGQIKITDYYQTTTQIEAKTL